MTQLSMPYAGTNPGRPAQAQPQPVDGRAGAVADFGQVMLDVGTALENDRLDREIKRAQVDMTRELNDLRLQVEGIGDPDAADAAWQQGVEQLRSAYVAPAADGRARISPANADRFGLAFDDLANRHASSLGARSLELRQSGTPCC
jgi:hypothetical protein